MNTLITALLDHVTTVLSMTDAWNKDTGFDNTLKDLLTASYLGILVGIASSMPMVALLGLIKFLCA